MSSSAGMCTLLEPWWIFMMSGWLAVGSAGECSTFAGKLLYQFWKLKSIGAMGYLFSSCLTLVSSVYHGGLVVVYCVVRVTYIAGYSRRGGYRGMDFAWWLGGSELGSWGSWSLVVKEARVVVRSSGGGFGSFEFFCG